MDEQKTSEHANKGLGILLIQVVPVWRDLTSRAPDVAPPSGSWLPGSYLNRGFGGFLSPPSTRLLLAPGGKMPLGQRVDTLSTGEGCRLEGSVLRKTDHPQCLSQHLGSSRFLEET